MEIATNMFAKASPNFCVCKGFSQLLSLQRQKLGGAFVNTEVGALDLLLLNLIARNLLLPTKFGVVLSSVLVPH